MTPTYDQMGDWLEEIAARFPEAFFEDLDGGIQLEEGEFPDPAFPPGEMYVMGEYVHDLLGRYINLYYGSFAAMAENEDWTEADWEEELRQTLSHELTHHMEGRSGLHALEDKDEAEMASWREEYGEYRQ